MKNNKKNSTFSLTTITHVTTDQGYFGTLSRERGEGKKRIEGKVKEIKLENISQAH